MPPFLIKDENMKLIITGVLIIIAVLLSRQALNDNKYPKQKCPKHDCPDCPKCPEVIKKVIDPIRNYDTNKLLNPLEEPTRRGELNQLPWLNATGLVNIPTQGYPEPYSQYGILMRVVDDPDDKENRILKLFGRQKYSNSYQYYTAINVGYDQVKVTINKDNTRELYDGDTVNISELNGAQYTIQLYKKDELIYNPYVY
jgi:hypothetical protein